MDIKRLTTGVVVFVSSLFVETASSADAPIGVALCEGIPALRVPPIYMTLNEAGQPMRGHLERSPDGLLRPVRFRVWPNEIAMLCDLGYDVRALPQPRNNDGKVDAKGLVSQIPSSFTLFRLYGVLWSDNVYTSASAPSGYTTQYTTFDLEPIGFSTAEEHVAVALFLDGQAQGGTPPSLVGNGIVLGNVSETYNGCGSSQAPSVPAMNTQYEAFWATGNYLWPGSCASMSLSDSTTHSVEVHASTGSWVWYQRTTGGTTYSASAVYTLNQRPSFDATNGGIYFGVTNETEGGDFSLYFTNVVTGWF